MYNPDSLFQQPLTPKTKLLATSNYQVIQQTYIEQGQRLSYTIGKGYILVARLGITRRVVMRHYYLRSQQFECSFGDKSVVDDRSLHSALAHSLTLDYAVRICQIEHPALLVLQTIE